MLRSASAVRCYDPEPMPPMAWVTGSRARDERDCVRDTSDASSIFILHCGKKLAHSELPGNF